MGATVQGQIANGAGPTKGSAEGGVKYGRDDLVTSTATLPIPTATGTKYSYLKYLLLNVTATAATNITNRTIAWASSPATGIAGYFKNQATYAQNNGTQGTGAGNYPADAGTNGAVPSGYTAISTSAQQWDNTSVSAGSTGQSGNYVQTCIAVDFTFLGGAGTATLPSLYLAYDEA